MKMIPSFPRNTHSSGERRVFDRLRSAFDHDGGPDLTAFHSLNLTRHACKRFGEIDFVIVGRPGVLVLEVKGGGISCHDGVWYSTDRAGRKNRLKESPFRQAEWAMHGLRNRVDSALAPVDAPQLAWGYGVVFPDCDWSVSGAEWDPAMVADARSLRTMERWLSGLFRYWRQRNQEKEQGAGDQAVDALKRFLRPEFDVGIPLHVTLDELEESVASLTEDQMGLLDIVDANPRVICTGGAGTGKTFLAMELARRWSASGRQVLLACQSPWLKRWLEKRFSMPGVTISVAKAVRTAARRAGIVRFDALIVDEGQDLLDMEPLEKLDAVLAGGLEAGRWCFFHDLNNQAGYFGAPDPDALALLDSYSAAQVPLTRNCRNTRQILEQVQSLLGADMGVRGTGDGPDVACHDAADREESASVLAQEIERLTGPGGLSPSEITILSPLPFRESAAALLPRALTADITELDEYVLLDFPPKRISFAQTKYFKGLENEAVILMDLPRPSAAAGAWPDHYVGMSRARSLLVAIFSEAAAGVAHPTATS
jgi:hypothetical protein